MRMFYTKRMHLLTFATAVLLVSCAGQGGYYDTSGMQTTQNNGTVYDRIASLEKRNATLQKELQATNSRVARLAADLERFEEESMQLAGLVDTLRSSTSTALPELEKSIAANTYSLNTIRAQLGISEETQVPQKTKEASEKAKTTPSLESLYKAGLASFEKRDYTAAIQTFTHFIETYPEGKLVDNAYFWLGESYYQSGNYRSAALEYEKVIKNYPKSNKLPAAYLKQGMSFLKLKNTQVARIRLEDVVKKFPKSPEAKRAKTVLSTIK